MGVGLIGKVVRMMSISFCSSGVSRRGVFWFLFFFFVKKNLLTQLRVDVAQQPVLDGARTTSDRQGSGWFKKRQTGEETCRLYNQHTIQGGDRGVRGL